MTLSTLERPQLRELSTLPGGGVLQIRALCESDRSAYEAAVAHLSPETLRMRFAGPKRGLTPAEIDGFLDVGHDGKDAIVAVVPNTGDIVGVARFAPIGAATGEVAVTVSDDWQGRGVGTTLMRSLVRLAFAEGYDHLHATTLVDNVRIGKVLRRHGFRPGLGSLGVVEWTLHK
ncbi:MAG TPA: GNAT family N-acetyltransferase [Acidimicrobiales bacterium]|nr:GNAT family N-acetyltransferase [Acidimicrobiales bacterium]